MDRFIDEQDSSRDRSSSPNFYSLMFGGSDGGRKGLSLYPGASSKSSFHIGSESNGSAEPVINVSNSSLSTPSTTSAPVQSSQSLASPTNGGRFPPLGDEDRDNPSEQTTNQWFLAPWSWTVQSFFWLSTYLLGSFRTTGLTNLSWLSIERKEWMPKNLKLPMCLCCFWMQMLTRCVIFTNSFD